MPSEFQYTWHGKRLESLFQRAALTALTTISRLFVALCRDAVSDPYPPASTPGHPPHRRTGLGQRSIVSKTFVDKLQAALVVQPRGFYMVYLEYGTHRILPRPWLRLTLLAHTQELESVGNNAFAQVMASG